LGLDDKFTFALNDVLHTHPSNLEFAAIAVEAEYEIPAIHWKKEKMAILVLGGAGYIGSHAARALRRSGYEVVLYDNLSTGFRRLAQGFELVEGDIADEARLRPVLARVDAVMHFAAHAYVGESVENPRKYFRNNVLGALSLLNSALDAGIRRFVFSSTCAVYGIPEQIPITEQTPREPVNPYGASKFLSKTHSKLTAALTDYAP
jgi:UDP-glucose 4-epimerase